MEESINLENLPINILFSIAQEMSSDQLYRICLTSKTLNLKLCANEDFWQNKYIYDFGEPEEIPENWQEAYEFQTQPTRAWIFGNVEKRVIGLEDEGELYTSLYKPTLLQNFENIVSSAIGSENILLLTQDGNFIGLGSQIQFFDDEGERLPPPILSDLVAVSAGHNSSLFLNNLGQVLGFGNNEYGQLGLGREIRGTKGYTPGDRLEISPYFHNIVAISSGNEHSLALDSNGKVWSFGADRDGQLGHLSIVEYTPKEIPKLDNIVDISAGRDHSLVLDSEGNVLGFGDNENGQLGIGDERQSDIPILISGLKNIIAISSGANHSLVLDENKKVWSFGDNEYGQLGIEGINETNIPIQIPSLENIVAISAGYRSSLALDKFGDVWAFGINSHGRLGFPKSIDKITKPTKIPGLENIISIETNYITSIAIGRINLVTFIKIEKLLQEGKIINYQIREDLKNLTSDPNVVMSFITSDNKEYFSIVYLDKTTNKIYPKFTPFSEIKEMLQTGKFIHHEIRDDMQQLVSSPNIVMAFITPKGDIYNAVVYYDSDRNQILNAV